MINRLALILGKNIFSFISPLVPRKESIWVVGGGKGLRYADNSMHFFKQGQLQTGLRIVWLTHSRSVLQTVRNEGSEAHMILSFQGLWIGLRAKWHVFDTSPADTGITSYGALRLNLWHGVPLKRLDSIAFNNRSLAKRLMDWIPSRFTRRQFEHLLHPNLELADHVAAPLNINLENLFIENLPRNAPLVDKISIDGMTTAQNSQWRKLIAAHRSEGKAVIGYFPTWRSDGKDRFLGMNTSTQIEALTRYLESNKCILVTKWHTCSFHEYNHPGKSRAADDISARLSQNPGIIFLDFAVDLNSVLDLCDVLLTDYSSVLFDYLLVDRPQIFVPYDLQTYQEQPGLLFDYRSFVPGPIVNNVDELLQAVTTAFMNDGRKDPYQERRRSMRNTYFDRARWTGNLFARMCAVSRNKRYLND